MFCRQCGARMVDDARFCPQCGLAIAEAPVSSVPAESTEPMPTMPSAVDVTPAPHVEAPKDPDPKRKRVLAIGAIAIVVIVVLAGVGIFAFMQNKAYEDAHRTSLVTLVFDLPDYGEGEGTGVPVEVTGTDLDGNGVSETFVAPAKGGEVELRRGTYQARVVGSPVGDTGQIYEVPQPIDFTIDDRGVELPGDTHEPAFGFTSIPPDQATDEQIQAIRDWLGQFGFSQEEVDRIVGQATTLRQQELDRIAEEQRKAEEEARRKAEEEVRQRAVALAAEAFASFPRQFTFTSGAGGWSTEMAIAPDGSFTGQWHDSDMGVTGPGYPGGTVGICDFAGSFTVLEKVSATDYRLQMDQVYATQPASEYIQDGRKFERVDNQAYGLGPMTSTPVSGWHLYLPGQSTAGFSKATMGWLYPGGSRTQESTLSMYALVNEDLGYAWFSK